LAKKINLSIFFFVLILFLFNNFEEISLIKRIHSNFDTSGSGSGKLRLFSLAIALDIIRSSPILGTGFGAYSFVVNDIYQYDTFEISRNIVRSSFNPYVQMICEAGFIGLFVFIYFIYSSLNIFRFNDFRDYFLNRFRVVSYVWLLVFFLTCMTANWFLPSSFLFILVVTLIGLNLKVNQNYIEGQSVSK
jgi:O-antigen ligase